MITHDCPASISKKMFVDAGLAFGSESVSTRTGTALQAMWDIHQPEEWYFGHWHVTKTHEENGTKFQCIGIDDFIDVEL